MAALPTAAARELRTATTGDHAPFCRVDGNGEIRGLDVEIALGAESARSARSFSTHGSG